MFVSPLSHSHLHFLLLLLIFGSSDLDEGPGKDADPLNSLLGCTTGMSLAKFQPWGLHVPGSVILDCPAGSAAVSLRDNTRDAFARMETLDIVKKLVVPKLSMLVEEQPIVPPDSSTQTGRQKPAPPSAPNENVKGKTSFRRLSDVLHPGQNSVGGNVGPWLVVFNDVVLQ